MSLPRDLLRNSASCSAEEQKRTTMWPVAIVYCVQAKAEGDPHVAHSYGNYSAVKMTA